MAIMRGRTEDSEKIVMRLLKPPGLQYIRELSKVLERDPEYLVYHSASVSLKVKEILSKDKERPTGVHISENNVGKIVKEAVIRLRSVEK